MQYNPTEMLNLKKKYMEKNFTQSILLFQSCITFIFPKYFL